MKLRTLLELGRTSNLPTVVSNTITGSVLAATIDTSTTLRALATTIPCCALLYVGGMFLNDAFDAPWDRQHRPERPIPRGDASPKQVFAWSLGMLCGGIAILILSLPAKVSLGPVLTASVLTVASIFVYNRWHKGSALAPWVMGMCRVGVVAIAALALTSAPASSAWMAAASIGAYVVGLTHVARFETTQRVGKPYVAWLSFAPALVLGVQLVRADHLQGVTLTLVALALHVGWVAHLISRVRRGLPRAIPKAVGGLIAGVSLVDAAFAASVGAWPWVLTCWACFVATLAAQRRIAGT